VKINFINPFGTSLYDGIIKETLSPYSRGDTQIVISHLEGPENIDYYYSKHIIELAVCERVMKAEEEGFDAVIVGCCYDPGVRVARELVSIPVIGPLEASILLSPYYGHDYVIVTDHHKAVPYLRDMVKVYASGNCLGVSCINWWITDMIRDTEGVARDAQAAAKREMENAGAEVAILACTIISACTEKYLREHKADRDLTILNPNTMALKMAESLADLSRQGLYNISRQAYYQGLKQRNSQEFRDARARFGKPGPTA
jgi:allantoin racemase